MKRLIIVLLGIFCWMSAFSQLSDKENSALDKLIEQQIKIEADAIDSKAIRYVFNTMFYDVKRIKLYSSVGGYDELVLFKSGNNLLELIDPQLIVPFVKPSYKLIDDDSAQHLQKAFALLFDDGGRPKPEIIQKDKQWIFVQNEWFSEKHGFIVTVNDEGLIKEIERSDNLLIE